MVGGQRRDGAVTGQRLTRDSRGQLREDEHSCLGPRRHLARASRCHDKMSKRKEPEGATPAAAASAPPRFGDHSSYTAETLVAVADVRIKVEGGAALPARTVPLLQRCGALARSPELFVGASAERPVPRSAPLDEYAEADVARFPRRLCASAGAALPAEDLARPAVVRLAHALDAAPVLAAAQRQLAATVRAGGRSAQISEACRARRAVRLRRRPRRNWRVARRLAAGAAWYHGAARALRCLGPLFRGRPGRQLPA
jgi:hypothetical protein